MVDLIEHMGAVVGMHQQLGIRCDLADRVAATVGYIGLFVATGEVEMSASFHFSSARGTVPDDSLLR